MYGKGKLKLVKLFTNKDKKKKDDACIHNMESTARRKKTRFEPLPAITPKPKLVRENTYKVLDPLVIRSPQDYLKYRLYRAKSEGLTCRRDPSTHTSITAPSSGNLPDKLTRSPRDTHLEPLPPSSHGRISRTSGKNIEPSIKPQEIKQERTDKLKSIKRRVSNDVTKPKLKSFEGDPQESAFWIPV